MGISSIEAASGTSIWLIMIYPALFTSGMMLIDTIDGAAMFMVYTGKFFKSDPLARIFYSIILTALSVCVALVIGFIQMFTLILETANVDTQSRFWSGVSAVGDKFDVIGGTIVGVFAFVVLASIAGMYVRRRLQKARGEEVCMVEMTEGLETTQPKFQEKQ